MKTQVVEVPSIKTPIMPSPGFAKKQLSDFKLDLIALCQFACLYCSSNFGNYLRINRSRFADLAEQQLGVRSTPDENPNLMLQWSDFLEKFEAQLTKLPADWGRGQTLVFSMLTDGFSPLLVSSGRTQYALQRVLDRTGFRVRVLTKNAIVGQDKWCRFFLEHQDRFVVGLSVGSLDDRWAKRVEKFTPPPSSRLTALHQLQAAGVPTYGMLCPIFPDVLEGNRLAQLVDAIRPDLVEHVWAEPFNDRKNWMAVRAGYDRDDAGYRWMTAVFEQRNKALWSQYATELYVRLKEKAAKEGWIHKLRYLLYEDKIAGADAKHFRGLKGVLLQSKPGPDGKSRNPHIAEFQRHRKYAR